MRRSAALTALLLVFSAAVAESQIPPLEEMTVSPLLVEMNPGANDFAGGHILRPNAFEVTVEAHATGLPWDLYLLAPDLTLEPLGVARERLEWRGPNGDWQPMDDLQHVAEGQGSRTLALDLRFALAWEEAVRGSGALDLQFLLLGPDASIEDVSATPWTPSHSFPDWP